MLREQLQRSDVYATIAQRSSAGNPVAEGEHTCVAVTVRDHIKKVSGRRVAQAIDMIRHRLRESAARRSCRCRCLRGHGTPRRKYRSADGREQERLGRNRVREKRRRLFHSVFRYREARCPSITSLRHRIRNGRPLRASIGEEDRFRNTPAACRLILHPVLQAVIGASDEGTEKTKQSEKNFGVTARHQSTPVGFQRFQESFAFLLP